jgi:hypothetical protein
MTCQTSLETWVRIDQNGKIIPAVEPFQRPELGKALVRAQRAIDNCHHWVGTKRGCRLAEGWFEDRRTRVHRAVFRSVKPKGVSQQFLTNEAESSTPSASVA